MTADGKKYVRYRETGEEELYDLKADPYELQNLAEEPGREAVLVEFKARADAIRDCAGPTCQATENH